jgi:gluconolactonase
MLTPMVTLTAGSDHGFIASGAKLEKLFSGAFLAEGPAVAPDGGVYFCDITATYRTGMQAGHLMKFDPKTGTTVVFRSPSGMCSGIKFDAEGRMVVAEGADYGGRRITRTDMKTGKSVVLAGRFEERPFNSPNDLALDEKGRIYFTDPRYHGWESVEQPVEAVYRIDPDGSIHRIITDAVKPNGLVVSADQRILYVGIYDNGSLGYERLPKGAPLRKGRMEVAAYDLAPDGTAKFRKTLVDYYPQNGPDGMTVDVEGNLYVAVRDETRFGIYVYSPAGKDLDYVPTPENPTNVAFGRGQENKTLYITAGGSLYRIKMQKEGYSLN